MPSPPHQALSGSNNKTAGNTAASSGSVLERATLVSMTASSDDVCPDPDRYVSYDGLHPTSWVQLVAMAEPFAAQQWGWRRGK